MDRNYIQLTDRSEFKASMTEALSIDPGRTAVVTIDLQRKYLDLEIGESCLPVDECHRVTKANLELVALARKLGIPVVHAYVVRREAEIEGSFPKGMLPYLRTAAEIGASQVPGVAPNYRPDRIEGSEQAELLNGLARPQDFHVTTKKSWDSFQYTDLDHLLRETLSVDTLVIGGVNTDTCVYSTVFAAGNRGYRAVVVSDCVGSMRGLDSHQMALELMSRSVAWVITLDEFGQKVR